MRPRLLLISLFAVVAVAAADEPRQVQDSPLGKRLARLVEGCGELGFSGAVLAARDGQVVVAIGVGPAGGEARCSARTLFEIASATKQLTGAAVMKLVDQQKLGLDDPIHKHLPKVPASCAKITIRHLLQHTSGIPGTNTSGAGRDLERVVPLFLRGGPQHEPGSKWAYWNQGYALCAAIVEKASGVRFGEFCRRELFAPAKMATARFTGDAAPEGAPVATGFSPRGNRTALEHPYGAYEMQYMGMGGAVCSVWDLWRWDRALKGEAVLSAAAKRELFKPGLRSYALGWFVERKGGRLVQHHGGGVRGFICQLRRYPEQDGCLVVLCNRDRGPAPGVADLLERALFGEAVAPPPARLPEARQKALAGRYRHPRARLIVTPEGGLTRALIEWWPEQPNGPRTRGLLGHGADGELVFFTWSERLAVTIERDAQGAVGKLVMGKQTYVRE